MFLFRAQKKMRNMMVVNIKMHPKSLLPFYQHKQTAVEVSESIKITLCCPSRKMTNHIVHILHATRAPNNMSEHMS